VGLSGTGLATIQYALSTSSAQQISHGSNKRQRDIQRIAHLVGAAALMLYLYTPLGNMPIFTALMQFLVVPLLIVTGMLMWQLPRLRKLLQGNRLAGQASKRTA
jgi:hypothetical protein